MAVVGLNLNIANACYNCGGGVYGDTDSPESCPPVVEPVTVEPTASFGGGLFIDYFYPSIKKANFSIAREGNVVDIQWLFTQQSYGEARVYQDGVLILVIPSGNYTFHKLKFEVPNGEVQVLPVSIHKGIEHYGVLSSI